MATALETQLLYITYFGRPADPAGLAYWTTGPQAALPLDQVADFFASDVEFAQTTAGKTTEQIINSFYVNAFGRQADAAGLQFWTAKVNNGEISIQDVGLFIALGALAQPAGSPDRVALESKQTASQTWTGLVAADVTATLEYAGPLAATFGVDFLVPVTTTATIPSSAATQASINGLPPVGTVALLSSNASSVTEGGTVIFQIQTIPDLAGQTIAYELSGVQAADVVGGNLAGTVTISATGVGLIQVTIATDAISPETETLQIDFPNQIVFSKPTGSDSVVIVDVPVPLPDDTVLTTATDVVTATAVPEFTFIGNEQTLGQNDQLTGRAGTESTLLIGTDGSFTVDNFTSFGIQTLELNPSGEDFFDSGFVDLSRAFGLDGSSGAADGLTKININQSELAVLALDDIQSAVGFTTTITDSFSTIFYNFDVNALASSNNLVNVIIEETPVDATSGEALGLDFTQGPLAANASIETLALTSLGSITNVVDLLSVGDALTTLVIDGDASLDITTDLGLPVNDNRRISTINAFALDGDLSLRYTSILGDVINNFLPDVSVFGAIGDNFLELGTQSPTFPTDFFVVTQDGDDTVFTVGGDDELFVGEGDNLVDAGDGRNTVSAGVGDDTITTGDGIDLVQAGDGDNSVDTNDGNDTITSGSGDDTINAGADDDVVNAGDGDNAVTGGFGDDSITTGSGQDFIVGDVIIAGDVIGAGDDTISSGAGSDVVFTGSGANLVDAGDDDDLVVVGEVVNDVIQDDTFANTVLLGLGNDELVIDTDSLTFADSINGGAGIDTINLANGGTLLRSETLRVSRIEALDLIGPSGDYSITLSDELVRTSDDIGSRIFSVFTSGDFAGNVTLDLSFLSPVDLVGNLISIRYSGQDDTDSETVIIRDELISPESVLAFGEAPLDQDETFADTLLILDSADVTAVDLVNVTGLEVIELGSSVNGPQTFTFDLRDLSVAQFNSLVGDINDVLIIRATPLLAGSVSSLNIDLTGADPLLAGRIIVEQSADLNVSVVGVPPGFVVINTALFYTPNADNLVGTAFSDTFTAFQLSDVQVGDFANGLGGVDTLELEFAVSNPLASLALQLSLTNISSIEIFDFNPAAVNQPVRFSGIGLFFAPGLQSIFTAGGDDFLDDIERSLFIDAGGGNNTVDLDAAGTVVTAGGNDSVLGSGGNDSIVTGGGNDTVDAQGGADSISVGEGNDSVLGDGGNDTIDGGTGNNTINAGTGEDSVITGVGNDSIVGGTGSDTINAGDGTNTVLAGLGADSVVTGTGADSISTADGTEVENDTVSSGAGADTVRVGLGDDSVTAGAGNDLIVLGVTTLVQSGGIIQTDELGGFTPGDRINGGADVDTLVFALDGAAGSITTVTGVQVQNVEVLNASPGAINQTLVLDTTLLPLPTGGRLAVNLDGDINSDGAGFTLNATSFVQGQAVDVLTVGLDTSSTYNLGAGNDTFTNFTANDSDNVTVAGNGGADTINLSTDAVEFVRYNTGNDGGTGGTGTGGDFITGYSPAADSIFITGGLLTDIGGLLSNQVTNAQLTLGGLSGTGNPGNNLSGRNILNLTGPARSLTDAQLFDANAVAGNINGVGVVGNGLAFGDLIGLFNTVDAVTNQALIVQQGQTDTALYLYTESSFDFANPQAYTVEASELRQLGVFDNSLFTGTELV